MIEVNKSIDGPQAGPQLFACDDLSRMLQQHGENLEGLLLKPSYFGPVASQLSDQDRPQRFQTGSPASHYQSPLLYSFH